MNQVAESEKNYCSIFKAIEYDRTPILSASELAEIERLVKKWQKIDNRKPEHFTPLLPNYILYRLLKPIEDVWAILYSKRDYFWIGTKVLIREMARRKTPYWAWQYKDWEKVVRSNSVDFKKFHRVSVYPRRLLATVNYLLCDYNSSMGLNNNDVRLMARTLFGKKNVEATIELISSELYRWGYAKSYLQGHVPHAISLLLLLNHSANPQDVSVKSIEYTYRETNSKVLRLALFRISSVFFKLGFIDHDLQYKFNERQHLRHTSGLEGVPEEWGRWITQWYRTSTSAYVTRRNNYQILKKVGRWLKVHLPNETSPLNWTRDTAATVIAAVDRMKIGDWNSAIGNKYLKNKGKPYGPAWKNAVLGALRVFFRDCHCWEWFPRRFDPTHFLKTPNSIRACVGPNPRTITDDIWAKLLWAGINLKEEDLPKHAPLQGKGDSSRYPLEMVKAVALVWLFAGLRSNEIKRLPIGCIRWQKDDIGDNLSIEKTEEKSVCWLEVPINKTYSAFTKPVDKLVGEAIEAWERVRPEQQPIVIDKKANKTIQALFQFRGKTIGIGYINISLIPSLCRKAGIPRSDGRGINITSHRARSTIASQLYNAKEPLTLFELQEWLGHREISSTQYYAKLTPTKVAKAYEKAGYFERNVRTIEVLIDQDVIKDGSAAMGEPYMIYELGHGKCTYTFFDRCPHRMACAKCSFYIPNDSSKAQILKSKANMQRMLLAVPLQEDERAAVEDDIQAMDKLLIKLANVPTPAGPTPREIATKTIDQRKPRPIITKTSTEK